MSSTNYVDSTPAGDPPIRPTFLHYLRSFWCRHREVATMPRAHGMPAHTVCLTCGWREPVQAAAPHATRTWDSTRDEARYVEQKRQREAIEARQHIVTAARAEPLSRTPRRNQVLPLRRASGQ